MQGMLRLNFVQALIREHVADQSTPSLIEIMRDFGIQAYQINQLETCREIVEDALLRPVPEAIQVLVHTKLTQVLEARNIAMANRGTTPTPAQAEALRASFLSTTPPNNAGINNAQLATVINELQAMRVSQADMPEANRAGSVLGKTNRNRELIFSSKSTQARSKHDQRNEQAHHALAELHNFLNGPTAGRTNGLPEANDALQASPARVQEVQAEMQRLLTLLDRIDLSLCPRPNSRANSNSNDVALTPGGICKEMMELLDTPEYQRSQEDVAENPDFSVISKQNIKSTFAHVAQFSDAPGLQKEAHAFFCDLLYRTWILAKKLERNPGNPNYFPLQVMRVCNQNLADSQACHIPSLINSCYATFTDLLRYQFDLVSPFSARTRSIKIELIN